MNLTTPCHGEPLLICTTWDSAKGMDVPDEIGCPAKRCPNWWEPDGTVGYYHLEETN